MSGYNSTNTLFSSANGHALADQLCSGTPNVLSHMDKTRENETDSRGMKTKNISCCTYTIRLLAMEKKKIETCNYPN